MDWQPIDTAPRNGDDILVVHRDNRSFLQIVSWDHASPGYPWCAPDGPSYHKDAFDFWMPLPESPTDVGSGQ